MAIGLPIPFRPPAARCPDPDLSVRCLWLSAGSTGSQTRPWSALGLRAEPALCLGVLVVNGLHARRGYPSVASTAARIVARTVSGR